jgi:hypothetical protein
VLATRLALVENEPATMPLHGEDESLHLGDWRKLITSQAHLLAELAEAAPEPRSLRDVLGAEVPQCGADLLRGGFE